MLTPQQREAKKRYIRYVIIFCCALIPVLALLQHILLKGTYTLPLSSTILIFALININGLLLLLMLYLVLLIVMPPENSEAATWEATPIPDSERRRTTLVVGGGLILLGAWLLLGQIPGLDWITMRNLGPLLLIGIGIWMVANRARRREN